MEGITAKAQQKAVNSGVASTDQRMPPAPLLKSNAALEKKAVGYGLPCSRCHAYYPSDMHACPICKSPERITPTTPMMHSNAQVQASPALATDAQIEEERERFLKELRSQAFTSYTRIDTAATFRCVLDHQHNGSIEPAAVCHNCYSDARQQVDRMKAALYMDAKEAAEIVYEAVWADTSDSKKTYLNAATALLSELKKRAGIGLLLGSHQQLTH